MLLFRQVQKRMLVHQSDLAMTLRRRMKEGPGTAFRGHYTTGQQGEMNVHA